jgi:hypothetical protein
MKEQAVAYFKVPLYNLTERTESSASIVDLRAEIRIRNFQ